METSGLQEGSVSGLQPLHPEDAGTGERAGSASPSRRDEGVIIKSLRQTIGEVEVAGGSSLALGSSREISSIKTAVPNLGSSVDFPLWKRRFEGFALSNYCMQAYTTVTNIPVGDPSHDLPFFASSRIQ